MLLGKSRQRVLSLARRRAVCQEAGGGFLSFRLPDVLLRLNCETPRQLYSLAWSLSDEQGCFTFQPRLFSSWSDRTRRRWAARLVKWGLWEPLDSGGGRGKHPVYRIKGKAEYLKKEQYILTGENVRIQRLNKPGHEANDSKKSKPPLQDSSLSADQKSAWKKDKTTRREYFFQGWETLQPKQYGWKKCAQAFRIPLEELGVPNSVARTMVGIILARLKGHNCQICRQMYANLGSYLWKSKERLLDLVSQGVRKLGAWIVWAMTRLLSGQALDEPKSKQQRLREINEQLRRERQGQERQHRPECECHPCEKARVTKQRAEAVRLYRTGTKELERTDPVRRTFTLQDVAQRFGLSLQQARLLLRSRS